MPYFEGRDRREFLQEIQCHPHLGLFYDAQNSSTAAWYDGFFGLEYGGKEPWQMCFVTKWTLTIATPWSSDLDIPRRLLQ